MLTLRKLALSSLFVWALILGTHSASATPIVFNFDSDTPGVNAGSGITDTVGGLSMTMIGNASICNVGSGFGPLTGNILVTGLCGSGYSGGTVLFFSSYLSSLTFDYVTSRPGLISVAYVDITSSGLPGLISIGGPSSNFLGTGTLSGGAPFNLVIFDFDNTGFPDYALDNITATLAPTPVPEPSSIVLIGSGMLGLAGVVRRRLIA
jgi:hypothetical protein